MVTFGPFFAQCIIFISILRRITCTCQFPSYLTRDVAWKAGYSNDGLVLMYFNGDKIDSSRQKGRNGVDENEQMKCLEVMNAKTGKYLVEISLARTFPIHVRVRYTCMQFFKRSESVIQIRTSVSPMDVQSPQLCEESLMRLDSWPIVKYPVEYNPSVPCPFQGGYNLRMTYRTESVCAASLVPPRMEGECKVGDGVTINYRDNDCLFERDMKLKHNLRCIATWKDKTGGKEYTFIVLSHDSKLPWCMRLEEPLSNLKSATIFLDGKCVTNDRDTYSNTINRLTLELKKMVVSSLCENEFAYCSEKEACIKYTKFCHRSCQTCQTEQKICSFPEQLLGQWHVAENKSAVMNITPFKLQIPGEGSFKCLNVTANNRIALLHVFDNGCFPRVTCMETFKPSISALQFKLGKSLEWPRFPLRDLINDACQDYLLSDVTMKTAISKDDFATVSCKLPTDFGFGMGQLYLRDNHSCDACMLYSIAREDKFIISPYNCTGAGEASEHHCVTSYKFKDGTAVVAGSGYPPSKYKCWGFIGRAKKRRIVLLNLGECNEQKIKSVADGFSEPLKSYSVIEGAHRNICPMINDIPGENGSYKTLSEISTRRRYKTTTFTYRIGQTDPQFSKDNTTNSSTINYSFPLLYVLLFSTLHSLIVLLK